ncbi:MAG: ECF transporter S component [Oscillospiraceae bacterium]
MKNPGTSKISAKTVATVGMLCAIAFVANLISQVFPTVSGFLSFDLKDVVIVIGGFMMGPITAIVISVIVSLIEMLTVSSTGVIGLIMNILSSCAFSCVAAGIYRRHHNMKGAIIGLVSGILCMTVIMLLWNWLITPLYMKVPRDVVVSMLIPVFLPFNLLKGGINATLSMLLYKPIVTALRKANLVEASASGKGGAKVGVIAVSAVLLVSFVLLALVLAGVI